MTGDRVAAFLAGDRPDDVALYLTADRISNVEALLDRSSAEAVGDGVLLVVDGDTGRSVFERFTGQDAMDFTGVAMQREGHVDADLAGGECPESGDDQPHEPAFVFAFSEAQNEEVGGLYERGDVVHAYAQCSCGTAYSDKWVVDERDG
ncbi:Uncharacterized protein HSRCO_0398 [Halanaeroarchaeum sp. HSR-CO]|uniref:DUF5807 family protein n=1 Tax=Halanaeroarchaeum sp. HSR-CO TaxID=2866382 RepID=UPI00217F1B0D|nr:DUF5807 family protein [Halanaeroarchaeum sp. HSR-CO]UWG46695.1 Uncharacterized protein HSRCO_0398 [Halanaeroarchaeum sp. HSR-CO]